MSTTTRLGLPYPVDADLADVPIWMRNLALMLDDIMPTDAQGPIASRPASAPRGAHYTSTNEGPVPITYRYDGTQWVAVNVQEIPPGAMMFFAHDATAMVYPGWLVADFRPVSRTTYAALFNAIGVRHGAGNGTTTFNLPDTRGATIVGVDGSPVTGAAGRLPAANAAGAAGGVREVGLSIPNMPSHQHGGSTGYDTDGFSSPHRLPVQASNVAGSQTPANNPYGAIVTTRPPDVYNLTDIAHTHAIGAEGGNTPHRNDQPWLAATGIIKT